MVHRELQNAGSGMESHINVLYLHSLGSWLIGDGL